MNTTREDLQNGLERHWDKIEKALSSQQRHTEKAIEKMAENVDKLTDAIHSFAVEQAEDRAQTREVLNNLNDIRHTVSGHTDAINEINTHKIPELSREVSLNSLSISTYVKIVVATIGSAGAIISIVLGIYNDSQKERDAAFIQAISGRWDSVVVAIENLSDKKRPTK